MTYHKDKHMIGNCPDCPDGLLEEEAGPHPCERCQGTGFILLATEKVSCPECGEECEG